MLQPLQEETVEIKMLSAIKICESVKSIVSETVFFQPTQQQLLTYLPDV